MESVSADGSTAAPPVTTKSVAFPRQSKLIRAHRELNSLFQTVKKEIKSCTLENSELPKDDPQLSSFMRASLQSNQPLEVTSDAAVAMSEACKLFLMDLAVRSYINAEESRRSVVQQQDIAEAVMKTENYDFLADTLN